MTLGIETRRPGVAPFAVLAAVIAAGALLVGVFRLDRFAWGLPWGGICFFKGVTGVPCMTCGSTRVVARLGELDFAGAFLTNPLATVGIVGLFVAGVLEALLMAGGRSLRLGLGPGEAWRVGAAVVILVVLNWAYLIAAGI